MEELKRRKLRKGRKRRSRYEICHDRDGVDLVVRAVKYVLEKLLGVWRRGVCLVRVLFAATWKKESCRGFWRSSWNMRDETDITTEEAPTRDPYL